MNNLPVLLKILPAMLVLYPILSLVYYFGGFPYRGYVLLLAIVPLIVLIVRASESRQLIDLKLYLILGNLKGYSAYSKSLPGYRFVDIYNSVSSLASQAPALVVLETQHSESLADILNRAFYNQLNRRMKTPERVARSISEHEEGFFPSDRFWLRPPSPGEPGRVIRVRLQPYTREVILEVGASKQEEAEQIIKQILKNASTQSIYKNKMIEISFDQEVKDEYGSVEQYEKVDPIFIDKPPVTDEDIILDDETQKIIHRTIIDFHQRRQELVKVGLPGRRGVLFYGPPGTGKTFTCRYISNRLDSATTIVGAGLSLLHIKSICNIARMLQPSVVILEDIDLVYSARDQNVYTTALGELMDELDGFNPEDHIIFILTTNAIDRVEAAIRERPGRISQCVYFGAPSGELRRRYLNSILARYDCSQLNLDELINKTEGVTQAFLKELVYRAVQIATESLGTDGDLALTNEHFREALDEMRKSADQSGEAIIGFRVGR